MFEKYVRWILSNTVATFWVLILMCVCSIGVASRLRINPDMLDLMPSEEPSTLAIQQLKSEEGEIGVLTIGLRGDNDDVATVLPKLKAQFEALDSVEYAEYDIPAEWKDRLAPLQLTPTEIKHLNGRIQQALMLGPAAMSPRPRAS